MSFNITAAFHYPLLENGLTTADIIYFSIILLSSFIIAKIVSASLKRKISDSIPDSDRESLGKAVSFIIVIFGVLLAMPYLKVDLSALFVTGGLMAIVIGIAGQNFFSNAISGVILFFERPIKIGDNVGVGDIKGTVEDIQVLSTVIKTYDGVFTRIPNEKMFTAEIQNYVTHNARRFEYNIRIHYKDDASKAIRIIRDVVNSHPFALQNPGSSIFVDELGENGMKIRVRIWAPSSVWWDVKTDLLWKIKVALEESGIQIPLPQRTLWFADEVRYKKCGDKDFASDKESAEN